MAGTSTEPTPVEQRLIQAVTEGEPLDLAGDEPVDETAMRSWGQARTIRADTIREIVRGRLAADPDPRGLRLRGVRIAGRIDLENITGDMEVQLRDCFLPDGLMVRDAHLLALVLDGCRVEQTTASSDPAIDAVRFTARVMMLTRSTVTADCSPGAVGLLGAHIGLLDCSGARLENASGPALDGDSVQVDRYMFLRGGFTATGNGDTGAVRLLGAHIGQLECDGARLENTSGPALDGDSLRVDRYMFLRGGFTAIGAGDKGAVRLLGAHIGQLECDGARLENTSGPALHGDRLQVDQAMFLRGGFTATGNTDTGVVRLLGAHIGQLECDGARLENASGPALDGDSLQVDQSLFLRGGFSAIGAGDAGAIRLLGAHIGRQLDCSGARLENASGPALDGDSLQVGQGMFLRDGFTATGAGQAVIGLFGARIGGALWLETGQVSRTRNDGQALVDLDGTTYTGLPQPGALDHWLRLLKDHSPAYAAQPYQQLAAVHRAAGHDREVRTILMAQRRDQIARNAVRGWDRTWARLTGLTLGYGYQPWRALFMLLAVLTLSVTAAITAGHHRGLAHTSRAPTPQAACSTIEQIGIGLDLGTPLLKTGARDACAPTTTIAGQTLAVAGWLLQVLAWAFAALFIAGFTGAVRKT